MSVSVQVVYEVAVTLTAKSPHHEDYIEFLSPTKVRGKLISVCPEALLGLVEVLGVFVIFPSLYRNWVAHRIASRGGDKDFDMRREHLVWVSELWLSTCQSKQNWQDLPPKHTRYHPLAWDDRTKRTLGLLAISTLVDSANIKLDIICAFLRAVQPQEKCCSAVHLSSSSRLI